MRLLSFVVCLAVSTSTATASDFPFGSDALPYLASRASVVLESAGASASPTTDENAVAYQVIVKDTFRGEFPPGRVLVVAPVAAGAPNASAFRESAVFVAGPLTEQQKKEWGVGSAEPVYQLVAGEGGVVPLTPRRREALESYFSPADGKDGDAHYAWANRYVDDADSFLQRSAIFQLERHDEEARAINTLARAAQSRAVKLENRALAIQAIASVGASKALVVLTRIAENASVPNELRLMSVAAIDTVPGGDKQLRKWSGGSGFLGRAARDKIKD